MEQEKALVEAVLFLEAEPVDVRTIAKTIGLTVQQVESLLTELEADLKEEGRGLDLTVVAGGYQLLPKRQLWPRLRERYGKKRSQRLSRAAMETLSIIAYSQPITRAEIESLRGVSADGMMRLLLERELIKEVGKKDAPGKPVQYGTTREFLKTFGLASISDLPKLDETEEERFRLNG